MNYRKYFAHESAIIDDGAQIGKGSKIWHFCHIFGGAQIGANCVLGQNVMVAKTAIIGSNVKIQNNVSIFDGVQLEDGVFIAPSVVFTNVKNPRAFINRKSEFKKTLIKKGASIGANSTIICGVEIGDFALIGAGALVAKNIPAFALAIGNPAKIIGFVDTRANRLNFSQSNIAIGSDNLRYELKNNCVICLDSEKLYENFCKIENLYFFRT